MIDRLVALVGNNGEPVPVGTVGEIVVHGVPGRTLMSGYYGDAKRLKKRSRRVAVYGDLARCDADGYFYFEGRPKDMIKRSGEISPPPRLSL